MPATREWKWPGLQKSRTKWARFGLLLPCLITSVWLGHFPSHYTGRPHPRGGGEIRLCGELKLATGVQLGGLFATDRSCSYWVRQLWVTGWPLLLAIAWCLLSEFGLNSLWPLNIESWWQTSKRHPPFMSMTRPKEKSPPCSTPTPTNNDSDDADPHIHSTKQPMFPRFLVERWTAPLWRSIHIYIKRVYHKPIQLATHLQAVAVQVTLGSTPVNILSVYTPSPERLTTQVLSRLIRGLNGHILITADFNGHNYSWGSLSNDIRGDVVERFTNKNNLCIFNDGSRTYLKPQAQHSQNPTSAIDLPICTPDLALRCTWAVLPDTHGSDHYPVLISVSPTLAETDQGGDSNHWVFPKADWERFAESCMAKITGHILQDQDPLTSFDMLVISAAKDSIPRATTVPKKSNPWFEEECREMLRARRALDRKVHRGAETLMSFRRTQAQARRLFTRGKKRVVDKICLKALRWQKMILPSNWPF